MCIRERTQSHYLSFSMFRSDHLLLSSLTSQDQLNLIAHPRRIISCLAHSHIIPSWFGFSLFVTCFGALFGLGTFYQADSDQEDHHQQLQQSAFFFATCPIDWRFYQFIFKININSKVSNTWLIHITRETFFDRGNCLQTDLDWYPPYIYIPVE